MKTCPTSGCLPLRSNLYYRLFYYYSTYIFSALISMIAQIVNHKSNSMTIVHLFLDKCELATCRLPNQGKAIRHNIEIHILLRYNSLPCGT